MTKIHPKVGKEERFSKETKSVRERERMWAFNIEMHFVQTVVV